METQLIEATEGVIRMADAALDLVKTACILLIGALIISAILQMF
jgi:hypothetical protein